MGECCASGVYRRREPHLSPLYQVVEDYYESFERCYDERFEQKQAENAGEVQVMEPVLYPKGHH
jgi:hypothetical protein